MRIWGGTYCSWGTSVTVSGRPRCRTSWTRVGLTTLVCPRRQSVATARNDEGTGAHVEWARNGLGPIVYEMSFAQALDLDVLPPFEIDPLWPATDGEGGTPIHHAEQLDHRNEKGSAPLIRHST